MFLKDSRYEHVPGFQDGAETFPGVRPRPIGPAQGMIEHVLQAGERLDLLARHYYNDDRLWWRILDANPQFSFADDLAKQDMEGDVILIPKAVE
jgi:hypothetical protein